MSYLLTVSRMDFSRRKQRWGDPGREPTTKEIGSPELPIGYPGALVLVDDRGWVDRSVLLFGPKGMLHLDDRLLVACYSEIRSFSADLSSSSPLMSEWWCNDLHSLRPSPRGLLLAGTGVDLAVELSADGATLWQWWAADHGFSTDLRGQPWDLGRSGDHRRYSYPVELQSTHINCVAALSPQTFVATLLHCNSLIKIDRESGDVTTLLEGLGRPHAVRVLDDGTVTLADTTLGAGIRVRVDQGCAEVVDRVEVDSDWLHDAYYDGEGWMLVDGANSRVLHTDASGEVTRVDQFDREWCLYEVLPWRAPQEG